MSMQEATITDLKLRTEYECWLLEEVYRITDQHIAVENVDELVYAPTGAPPSQTLYCTSSINIGDWRPGFLEAGAPLVLVTAFKLLDMILEWVLFQNGQQSTWRFAQKVAALRNSPQFPALISSRPWLEQRLVSLYVGVEPLRGTIIHSRHFRMESGNLHITSSKEGTPAMSVTLSASDLRRISAIVVSLVRYLEGTWTLDVFREKRMRFLLDQIAHVHKEPLLGQREPGFINIRVYSEPSSVFTIDLPLLRRDAAAKRRGQDVIFDIRLVVVDPANLSAMAYLIPWARHANEPASLELSIEELAPMSCPLPDALAIEQLASQLVTRRSAVR
jgi:hypothetical protein